MEKMTLHEAQTAVAAIYQREGWGIPAYNWNRPDREAVFCAEQASVSPAHQRAAWSELRDILLAYHAHTVFEAGKAFSDKRSVRIARQMAAFHVADAIDDGLHYAEEIHQ